MSTSRPNSYPFKILRKYLYLKKHLYNNLKDGLDMNNISSKIPTHKKYNLKIKIELTTDFYGKLSFQELYDTKSSKPNKFIRFDIDLFISYENIPYVISINKKRKLYPNCLIMIMVQDPKYSYKDRLYLKLFFIKSCIEEEIIGIKSYIENFIINYEY